VQPWPTLVVTLPQQAVFLMSLHTRGLVTTNGALRLLAPFIAAVGGALHVESS
jgi:hypothetical protein